jgi:hypothetical protein
MDAMSIATLIDFNFVFVIGQNALAMRSFPQGIAYSCPKCVVFV